MTFEVAFVADDDEWYPINALQVDSVYRGRRGEGLGMLSEGRWTYQVIEDLITQDADHVKGLARGDGVDEHVAMNADEVFGV